MKRTIHVLMLAVLFAIGSVQSYAQTDKGALALELTDVTSDNEQVAAQMEMMKGMMINVHYADGSSITSMDMMGGMVKSSTVMGESGDLDLYMEMMGNKIWVEASAAELARLEAENDNAPDYDITYDKEDTKEILGFQCYKMTMVDSNNPDAAITGYITEDIKVNTNIMGAVKTKDFAGFPLELSISNPMVTMTFTAQDYTPEADLSKFEFDQSQYTKMTMEEFISQMGAMGGGMGF